MDGPSVAAVSQTFLLLGADTTHKGRQQTPLHYHNSRTPVANQTAPVGKLLLLRPPSSYISSHQNTAVKSLFGTSRRRRHLMPPDDMQV